MIKEMKRQLYLNRRDYLLGAILSIGTALLADVIVLIGLVFLPGASVPALGSLLLSSVAVLYGWLYALANTSTQYNMALKMGGLRWRFLLTNLLIGSVYVFALVLLSGAWRFLSEGLITQFGGQISFGMGLNSVGKAAFALNPSLALAAFLAVAATVLGMWIGALMLRFGKAVFWIIWGISMLASLGGATIGRALTNENISRFVKAIAAFMANLPIPAWQLGACLLLVLLAAHVWILLRRIPVQD